ncbi:amidophosphoribosyltransferase [Candidatus Hecatella orcuttiae]|uniref:amidophosphoribosyltransferase n=1 Tax=Candidatus Hecatella orcuttiae TaxID=1935119 RepID=UPI002868376E|nr:amidophosphoribosyltransferase [Candidatus Hecatella orcuttiae]
MSHDYPREACGVFGVCCTTQPAAGRIFTGLMALQHRGQESAGMALAEPEGRLVAKKTMGLVGSGSLLKEALSLRGKIGLGHVRYSTTGLSSVDNAQPFCIGEMAFCHNGNLVNYMELKGLMWKKRIPLMSSSDAEILLNILLEKRRETGDVFEALSALAEVVEGGYAALCLTDQSELLAFRDPLGLRPLCYGRGEDFAACASESVALDSVGGEFLSDVKPGEALLITDSHLVKKRFVAPCRRAHCMFEYVYFSRPDSVMEGKSVYDVRISLGKRLAKDFDCNADVIVPVPDTSRPAAEGMSRMSSLPVAEGLIKNRYIHRTFIMPVQAARDDAVKMKLNPLKSVLRGQRVILVDDSIVRGTTIRKIVDMVRRAGAREVHVRITCPPLISPCFYGIDIATHQELIASQKTVEEIRRLIGADSLEYQTVRGLVEAIGLREEELCLACLTGVYPTPKAQRLADRMRVKMPAEGVRYIEAEG